MFLWDYDRKTLEKSRLGQLLILERMINYGPGKEKIKISDVRKYWKRLKLLPLRRRLLELFIWGK